MSFEIFDVELNELFKSHVTERMTAQESELISAIDFFLAMRSEARLRRTGPMTRLLQILGITDLLNRRRDQTIVDLAAELLRKLRIPAQS